MRGVPEVVRTPYEYFGDGSYGVVLNKETGSVSIVDSENRSSFLVVDSSRIMRRASLDSVRRVQK
jgi:hypothetical protein